VLPIVVLLGICVAVAVMRAPADLVGGPVVRLRAIASTAPLSWLLWPFHLPLLPLAAATAAEWAPRFAGVMGLLALHLVWIVRADVAFEEAALDATSRRSALLDRWRKQGGMASTTQAQRRSWRPLAPAGHPGMAILWKNMTRLVRTVRPVFPLIMIGLMGVGLLVGILSEEHGDVALALVAGLSLSWAVMFGVLGPQWVRNDLRGELEHLPMLRTWPVSGLVVMTAEVASSALVLSALQVVLVLAGMAALILTGDVPIQPVQALGLALPMALLLTAINVIALAIQNGGALLYPSWVRLELRPGGIEMVGQQFLTAGASLLLLMIALLGPGLLGGGGAYLLWEHLGLWALGPAALLATAGLAIEAFLILDWLGTRFEGFDPTGVN
jgi:hypothetical protein